MKETTPAKTLGSSKSPRKTSAARRNAKLPRTPEGFASFIRDPSVVWYGPHQCNKCGGIVVKSSFQTGGLALNADDENHHYPNFVWDKHQCEDRKPG